MASGFSSFLLTGVENESNASLVTALDTLENQASARRFSAGDHLMNEGESGDAAYLIQQGEMDILRADQQEPVGHAGPGHLVGELALEGQGQRMASVVARTNVSAWRIAAADYLQAVETWPELRGLFTRKLYHQLSDKHRALQQRHEQLLVAQKEKDSLGFLMVALLLLLTGYALVNGLLVDLLQLPSESWLMFSFSRTTELLGVVILWQLVRRSSLTLRDMGLTRSNWQRSLLESLLLTVPAALMLLALATYLAQFRDQPTGWDPSRFDYSFVTYLLVAPLQEWVARGVFQTSLEKLLGQNKGWLAVLLSSLVFATLHLHLNPILSIVSLVSGLIWGWMFLRHRSLVGVSVSHFLLGNLIALLGLWALWT